ncbi:unnamed protein product, partial [Heligmosomoides polygyrus]|uniref:GRANULINS domain-containing protein n=1 Tax=Heligmosomoides polygyrus TaxID=6339 RepID=A0A183GHR9_HELPZ
CIDKFCPPGTFCDERLGPCCVRHSCASGEVCVERIRSCIGRSCKKISTCAKPGTCDALVCPPSQKCVADPTPKCVKHIPTVKSVIGHAHLAPERQ